MQCYSVTGRAVNVGDFSQHKTLIAGVALSVLVHGALAVGFQRGTSPTPPDDDDKDRVTVDIEVAPTAPKADAPEKSKFAANKKAADAKKDADAKKNAVAVVVPKPTPPPTPEPRPVAKPKPKPKPKPKLIADAGVPEPDAGGPAMASMDAGVPVASNMDAGPPRDAGTAVASNGDAGPPGDAGAAIASNGDAGPALDAGTAVATKDPTGPGTAKNSRTSANLLGYSPGGAKVTVLLRFDRLRGTEWAARTEAIFKPMPDYRSIMGKRGGSWTTRFDTMVISSPKPKDHRRTTVATKGPMSAAAMRNFLNGAGTKITWSSSMGGALGRRSPSARVQRSDPRVFLMPYPGWTLLTPPNTLGALTTPSTAALGAWASGTMPAWMRRLRGIEAESGQKTGPALMLTLRKLPPKIGIPGILSLRTPKRATMTMEIVKHGFLVRGTLVFANEADAKKFFVEGTKSRDALVKNFAGRLLLKRMKAFNAVKGLSLVRKGTLVTYATSISIADARRLFGFAATWAKNTF